MERYARSRALVANSPDPFLSDRARFRAALAASYDPVNSLKIQVVEWAKKRLETEKLHSGAGTAQMIDALLIFCVLDTYS